MQSVSYKTSNVHCLNPWDPQSKRQYMIDGVYRTLDAGQSQGGQAHGICFCFQQNQREEVRNMGEKTGALTAEAGMHNNNYLCYCMEGNTVDRTSSKNGRGWCKDVSPTLNTQDRHAVVYALEGNGARPSHLGKGFSEDGTMYTLNTIETHSVCYRKSCKPNSIGSLEKWVEDDITNTLNCFEFGNDTRTPELIVQHKEKDERIGI